ncbi:hypothetical protein OS493_007928 [Desmophyllum pertusum]|uniref:Uncharacterized protein n=1 Tax=Desmophyllum pertusum TaxID=174260 RepID=A0A9X0CHJ4_9CNID|nr:hypothetical protein OS493_007928 [Desmophyllum pertusum]
MLCLATPATLVSCTIMSFNKVTRKTRNSRKHLATDYDSRASIYQLSALPGQHDNDLLPERCDPSASLHFARHNSKATFQYDPQLFDFPPPVHDLTPDSRPLSTDLKAAKPKKTEALQLHQTTESSWKQR